MQHLSQIEECMTAMGGTVDAAKKRVKRVKNRDSYWENPEVRREERNTRYHNDPQPQNLADQASYWENPEARRDERNSRYHNDPQDALVKLSKAGRYGPSFPCVVCQELHWLSNVSVLKEEDMKVDFVCVYYVYQHERLFKKLGNFYCCNTCKKKVANGQIPRNAAKNHLECPWDGVRKEFLSLSEVVFLLSV